MMKYLLCLFLGAFLMLGLGHIPDRGSQEFREGAGTANMQPEISSNPNTVKLEVRQYSHETHAIGNKGYTHNLGEGMPSNLLLTRNIPPFKLLKFNDAAIAVKLLSHLVTGLSNDSSTSDTNLARFSYRYFVYALNRILI